MGNVISVAATGFILIPVTIGRFGWWLDHAASRRGLWAGVAVLGLLHATSVLLTQLLFDLVLESPEG